MKTTIRSKTVDLMNIILPALILAALLGACQTSQDRESQHAAGDAHGEPGSEVHWGYEGEIGPEHWADLTPEFERCREGAEQSPIDLAGATPVQGTTLERKLGQIVLTVEQRATVMDLLDNGHTIQVTNDLPMALDLDDEHYELVQYHFHAPSEHTIDGEHASLEVHFVHKSASRKLAVLGVLVEEGAHDPLWDSVIGALPSEPGDSRHLEELQLDAKEFQPLPERYYRYRGSLTTPPCSEGVEWIVMAERRQVSPAQMKALVSHLRRNNRPVQPLGDRELRLISK